MPVKIIGSPHPKYLAATDILISDMSNINYDFLIYDRPIILIANKWINENFPDIGIKTTLKELENAIKDSIANPGRFAEQRKYWHKRTMFKPDGKSSSRVLDEIIKRAGIDDPYVLLIHGDNDVSIVHLEPVYEEIRRRGIKAEFVSSFVEEKYAKIPGLICISTHNEILDKIKFGYKVHIDHSVKGKGVTYFEGLADIYRARDYYKGTDLQITEGVESFENTKKLMGPLKERVVMAGYPKSDTLIKFNTGENKNNIYEELGFDIDKILITYAPTGKYRYPFKQGASLSGRVLKCLKDIAKKNNYNLLIKLRSREPSYLKINKILKRIFIR